LLILRATTVGGELEIYEYNKKKETRHIPALFVAP
jgi:hypothetical protein